MGFTMNMTCNTTLDDLRIGSSEEILIGTLTAHMLFLILNFGFFLLGLGLSIFLMWMHAINYTDPSEQRQLLRVIFMVPIYHLTAFLCLYFYWHATSFQVVSATYSSIAIASYFTFLCNRIMPDGVHNYSDRFSSVRPKPWKSSVLLPIGLLARCCGGERGLLRAPRSGIMWFKIMWVGIFQYAFIRISMSIVALVTQYYGRYCPTSNHPNFAHIWVLSIDTASAALAMYCLDQFIFQFKEQLAPKGQRMRLKLWCIKAVFAFSLYQNLVFSILTAEWMPSKITVKSTAMLSYPDLKIGLPQTILAAELAMISVLHIFAFSWKPYKKTRPLLSSGEHGDIGRESKGGFLGLKAFVDAFNLWDLIIHIGRGFRWLKFWKTRTQEKESSFDSVPLVY